MTSYKAILTQLFNPVDRNSKGEIAAIVEKFAAFSDSDTLCIDKEKLVEVLFQLPVNFAWHPETMVVDENKVKFSARSIETQMHLSFEVIFSSNNKINNFYIRPDIRKQPLEIKGFLIGIIFAFGVYKILLN